jgi:hypothetical protein
MIRSSFVNIGEPAQNMNYTDLNYMHTNIMVISLAYFLSLRGGGGEAG